MRDNNDAAIAARADWLLGYGNAALPVKKRPVPRLAGGSCLMAAFVLQCGCRSLPSPGTGARAFTSPQVSASSNNLAAIVTHFPKQPDRFSTCQKVNPVWWLGNADEPVAPDWYRPGKSCRNVLWHLRNPCHNFDSYVIGLSDKPFTRTGRFPANNFNPNGGWNWAVCRYKRLRLPFTSYAQGSFRFYCGWREGGSFGIELKFAAERQIPAEQPKSRAGPAPGAP